MAAAPVPEGPPPTDLTGICFKDQVWLNTWPLNAETVLDYFAMSPFYDHACNNESLRKQGLYTGDVSQLKRMTGLEYVLHEAFEPHLYVMRKQRRETPDKVSPYATTFYVLDGAIYQAPTLESVIGSRVARCLYHVREAFNHVTNKLTTAAKDVESSSSKNVAGQEEETSVVTAQQHPAGGEGGGGGTATSMTTARAGEGEGGGGGGGGIWEGRVDAEDAARLDRMLMAILQKNP